MKFTLLFLMFVLLCSCNIDMKHKIVGTVDVNFGIDESCFPCFPMCYETDAGVGYQCVAETADYDCSHCIVGCLKAEEIVCNSHNDVVCSNYIDGIILRVPAYCMNAGE